MPPFYRTDGRIKVRNPRVGTSRNYIDRYIPGTSVESTLRRIDGIRHHGRIENVVAVMTTRAGRAWIAGHSVQTLIVETVTTPATAVSRQ